MSARIELAGKRFGRWTVVRYDAGNHWVCRCDCGAEHVVAGSSLRRGISTQCSACNPRQGNRKHGEKQTRLYNIWSGMKARCSNPNEPAYPSYGARGITVCAEWASDFSVFRDWAIANGYEPHLTIERRDNDGNYEPGNCCWIPLADQKMNRRNTVKVMWRGMETTLLAVSQETGVAYDLLKQRRRRGWSIEKAVSTPVGPNGRKKAITFTVHHGNIDHFTRPPGDTNDARAPGQSAGGEI